MRISRYSKEIKVDDKKYVLYNTYTRKYYEYSYDEKHEIQSLLNHLNKENYSVQEAECIKALYERGIIISDSENELLLVELKEDKKRNDEKNYHITILPTNACNFRCSYCTQSHEVHVMTEKVQKNIIDFINIMSKSKEKIGITWFGGEPLLQYSLINNVMSNVQKICDSNGCKLQTDFVTNGYLLTEAMIINMKEFGTYALQITVDLNKSIHDKRRILANGEGSYDVIIDNIKKVLKHNIKLVLRINIDEAMLTYPFDALMDIPYEYRHLVTVSISNIFQAKYKISSYNILKRAIDLGYQIERKNSFRGCSTCNMNNINIDTNGNILFCTGTKGNVDIGRLLEKGIARYNNKQEYFSNINKTLLHNMKCKQCIELPYCIGRCQIGANNNECLGILNDGLSIEERARLDYLFDKRKCQGGTS